ncbi:MAG: Com family DNA-binding transcriptional regulator [Magnetococcales bacterium]|nr:Com family DNA-binding transcriptional regulator [Magnetococcales bacterium]
METVLRCGRCNRVLAKGTGKITIRCTRCKTMNYFNHDQESHHQERHRAPAEGEQDGSKQ